jgi:hypothetical protein
MKISPERKSASVAAAPVETVADDVVGRTHWRGPGAVEDDGVDVVVVGLPGVDVRAVGVLVGSAGEHAARANKIAARRARFLIEFRGVQG